ncbi:hypothetical protein T10_4683 [Trichinella papuae]|uniref:Uncharacterized protein n=1 Tax=Trichinella papuae TaxID=268474 RepID=A0A0V1MKI6_9BILA|nr:hypothetical protein T10_4683 [Trichinella papuae]
MYSAEQLSEPSERGTFYGSLKKFYEESSFVAKMLMEYWSMIFLCRGQQSEYLLYNIFFENELLLRLINVCSILTYCKNMIISAKGPSINFKVEQHGSLIIFFIPSSLVAL